MGLATRTARKNVTETIYTCDWCGKEIPFDYFHPRPCVICQRYACGAHRKAWHHKDDGSDWPVWHCAECWAIGKPFRVAIEVHEGAIADQREGWHEEARKGAKEQDNGV